jgi:hypothetical protein
MIKYQTLIFWVCRVPIFEGKAICAAGQDLCKNWALDPMKGYCIANNSSPYIGVRRDEAISDDAK